MKTTFGRGLAERRRWCAASGFQCAGRHAAAGCRRRQGHTTAHFRLRGCPGTFDLGVLFVPPVPNFLGSSDPVAGLSMSIDYAGLADKTCGNVAGTTFAGRVKEKLLPGGRAEVSVNLLTMDAIAWVVNGFDFANDPVIFGVRWEDVGGSCVFNGTPVLGNSMLKVTFIDAAPGAPSPT